MMQLLGLPDELLSEILKHVGVGDKVQHVQRCCMRFRRLLQQPFAPGTWGSIGVTLGSQQASSISHLTALLQWLASRQSGISEVRLNVGPDVKRNRGSDAERFLCALAGVLAQTHVPLRAQYWQRVDIGGLSALTINVLAATLCEVKLTCCDFEVQHWATLCSLRSLQNAVFELRPRLQQPPVAQPPFTIQSMQLTKLQSLQFTSTAVEPAAPFLAHAAALTSLTRLRFENCSLGTLPATVLKLSQLSALVMNRCDLTQLPSLAPLTRLVSLHLSGNPALVDLRPALAATQRLIWLTLGATTPLTEANLEAVQGLPHLKSLDISKPSWSSNDAAAMGYLVQLTHDKGCKLIT